MNMIPCPLHYLTGLDCPVCGFQRGVVALWHGDIAAWWHYNPVLWCLMPYFLAGIVTECYRPWRNTSFAVWLRKDGTIFSVIGIMIIWGIVRNLI